jgi:hypothetical protein
MGAARINFPRSDVVKEFRATAHKALDDWLDEVEESFQANPSPNVMELSDIFQQSRSKLLASSMKASIERLFPSFVEQEWAKCPGCDRQLRRKRFESKEVSTLQGSFVLAPTFTAHIAGSVSTLWMKLCSWPMSFTSMTFKSASANWPPMSPMKKPRRCLKSLPE